MTVNYPYSPPATIAPDDPVWFMPDTWRHRRYVATQASSFRMKATRLLWGKGYEWLIVCRYSRGCTVSDVRLKRQKCTPVSESPEAAALSVIKTGNFPAPFPMESEP